jgi:hypothetical protein
MNTRLNYILAQQHIAELQRAAERARLATDAGTRRYESRDSHDSHDLSPIVRALPMPTAHPSPEAWPDANLTAGYEPGAGPPQRPLRAAAHQYRTPALDDSPHEGRPGPALSRSGTYGGLRGARERLRPAFVPDHGDELTSTAFSQPQTAPAGVERSEQLTQLVYELLDAHADTEHLSETQHSELLWHAHLRYLRDLQRVAREVLADVS